MTRDDGIRPADPSGEPTTLTDEERKSITHGDFLIPEREREVFARALGLLNEAGVRYVVSGLYALHHYTGIYRKTKDLDVFFEPATVLDAARILREEGFRTHLEASHWIAKAFYEDVMIDLAFGMGNGLHLIDRAWWRHSRPGKIAGVSVRIAPPEELILHRLFISERHRSDAGSIAHLLMLRGSELDWRRLLDRVGHHWRLLLSQIYFYDFCYPGRRSEIPGWARERLEERALAERGAEADDPDICQGTLVSRFSFAIDVNEWGFRDYRRAGIAAAQRLPVIEEIRASDVWDSVNDDGDFHVPASAAARGPARIPVMNGEEEEVEEGMSAEAPRNERAGEEPAESWDPGPDPRPDGPGQVDGEESPDGIGLRIGAVGDLHFDGTHRELIEAVAREAEEEADILVVPGDLTTHGEPRQARTIAEVFGHLTLPVVMVLGNHDHESGEPREVREILEGEGITVLDGEAAEIQGIGFAGVKGFPGGFGRGALGAFGEPLIKSFVQEAVDEAFKLENALRTLATTIKVVVIHYAPVTDTLVGEPEVIFPFLGSSRLLPPIESLDVDVVFHGHAHTGTIEGTTPGGVPVYNVSHPLLMATGGNHLLVWEAQPFRDAARGEPAGHSGLI